MKGKPPLVDKELEPCPASQWTAGLGRTLRESTALRHSLKTSIPLEIRRSPLCAWVIIRAAKNFRLGIRAPFDPSGFRDVRILNALRSSLEITAAGGMGKYSVRVSIHESPGVLLRWTTTLTPAAPLVIHALPRDLCALNGRLEPYDKKARLYTCQTENSAGQTFFSIPEGKGASVFYFQNFSALADYFSLTGSRLTKTVAGQWPEAGFALPGSHAPLAAGKPIVIADGFVELRAGLPNGEAEAGSLFVDSLARIYPLMPPPDCEYCDWPALSEKVLRALTSSSQCRRTIDGKTYLHAYIGGSGKPPESMVQGAITVPLMEYEAWRQRPVPLTRKLRHAPESFYHRKLKTLVRWLPGSAFEKEEPGEEEKKFRMDSWYLLHTMVNLARVAEMGEPTARKIFIASLPSLIRTAQRFNYDWPVFYDQRTLKVFKEETEPGKGGEQDAAGLYTKVMWQAYTLTHQQKYIDEAEASAAKLLGLSFGVLYQTNNTAMGAVALARLWRLTGKSVYKDLSITCVASILSHLWLWDVDKPARTFMALPPLHNAPYVAFYEEAEVMAALGEWQIVMRDEVPDAMALLLAEYHRHLLSRGKFYYPSELPADWLAEKPKEGPFNRRLAIPIEGLGPPGEEAGTVGQAVYAAAAPFILATRGWHHPPGAPCTLFCTYPMLEVEAGGNFRRGQIHAHIGGSRRLSCVLEVFPRKSSATMFRLNLDENPENLLARTPDGWSAKLPGGSRFTVSWDDAK
ncbi:MAG TPA: hypothetical protein VG796_21415 [Verrucomicrobiales bacterium]|nr:hypothetical protein [Verrucomicrobiales bacterium]